MESLVTIAEYLYSINDGRGIDIDSGMIEKDHLVTIVTKYMNVRGHHEKSRFNRMKNAVCC